MELNNLNSEGALWPHKTIFPHFVDKKTNFKTLEITKTTYFIFDMVYEKRPYKMINLPSFNPVLRWKWLKIKLWYTRLKGKKWYEISVLVSFEFVPHYESLVWTYFKSLLWGHESIDTLSPLAWPVTGSCCVYVLPQMRLCVHRPCLLISWSLYQWLPCFAVVQLAYFHSIFHLREWQQNNFLTEPINLNLIIFHLCDLLRVKKL